MFPSTGSGASYETTDWICTAPDLPFTVALPFGAARPCCHDLESGPQILANAEQDPIEMTQNEDGIWNERLTVSQ